jgi:hypothetical protein
MFGGGNRTENALSASSAKNQTLIYRVTEERGEDIPAMEGVNDIQGFSFGPSYLSPGCRIELYLIKNRDNMTPKGEDKYEY